MRLRTTTKLSDFLESPERAWDSSEEDPLALAGCWANRRASAEYLSVAAWVMVGWFRGLSFHRSS